MEQKIKEYLIKENSLSEKAAEILLTKIKKYDDIYDEFCYWLNEGTFKQKDALQNEGYTAQSIHNIAPQITGIGVYNIMIGLRDDKELTLKRLNEGFPVK